MKNALHLQWLSQWIQGKEEYVCPLSSSSHLCAISLCLSLLSTHAPVHRLASTHTHRQKGRHLLQHIIKACLHSSGPVYIRFQSLSSNRHMNSCMLAQTITTVLPFLNQTADAGVFFFFYPLQLANLLILHSLGETDNKDDGLQR